MDLSLDDATFPRVSLQRRSRVRLPPAGDAVSGWDWVAVACFSVAGLAAYGLALQVRLMSRGRDDEPSDDGWEAFPNE